MMIYIISLLVLSSCLGDRADEVLIKKCYMFGNKQVDISELPQVEQVEFKSLHVKYKTVVGIRLGISTLIVLIVCFLPYGYQLITDSLPLSDVVLLSIGGVGLLLMGVLCITTFMGIGMKGYALREHDIIYKTGLINRSQTVIPFNRVQHVGVYESALLRVFGLCTVEFFTAGGALGDLKISGISKEEGERLKAYVIQKITKPKVVSVDIETNEDVQQVNRYLNE